ncbi:tyrosine-protein phosphatase corkscrew isoform X2 [Hydra vulgaris]|uniref:protein-tyrosine-phosphatase n=1 Tax=Hydra vulgaris TaxID=6087 RepID=A0ABM4BLI1_HYDVU
MSLKWFHSSLNGSQAEELLTPLADGSFLVRPSESKHGDFTISVKCNGKVTHIKIQNDGDSFLLIGSPDPFPTLESLVSHYRNTPNSIKEKSGVFIELLYPVRSTDPTTERWYHGSIGAKEAERMLLSKGRLGSYLVRESQSQPGQFVLVVKCANGVQQVIISCRNNKYEIKSGPSFSSLQELIEYYVMNPKLHDVKDQSPIKLREPFQSTSFVASSINDRIAVLHKQYKNGVSGFREEFEQLQRFDQNDGVYTTNDGLLEGNRWKNRYKNILPYDHSRVRIKGSDLSDPSRDYINASYIDVELKTWKVKYIAAQGCLNSTMNSFWDMVYQHNSYIIVMLTNEMEGDKNKCAKYWPDLGLSSEYGKIVVDNMLEHQNKHFVMRELRVYHTDKAKKPPHMVYQYHFTDWPDHDAPADQGIVLGFLNEVHTKHSQCGRNAPIVVHCSAGIGRTGTVIVIDILMHLLDEQGLDAEIDIQRTTQLLRTQRAGMVQTELQYKFIYEAIKHFIEVESKREAVKKENLTSTSVVSLYGNLDFSNSVENIPKSSSNDVVKSSAPRFQSSSVYVKPTSPKNGGIPQRTNATRARVSTEPLLNTKTSNSKNK